MPNGDDIIIMAFFGLSECTTRQMKTQEGTVSFSSFWFGFVFLDTSQKKEEEGSWERREREREILICMNTHWMV